MRRRSRLCTMAALALLAGGAGAAAAAGQPVAAMLGATCDGCHGARGASHGSTIPAIAGQSEAYLAEQLRLFRAGTRPSSVMGSIAKGYRDPEIKAIAGHFAAESFARRPQVTDPALAARGKAIHDRDCERCHRQGGRAFDQAEAGLPGPILAGQWMPYLAISINEFFAAERELPPGMGEAYLRLRQADLEALLHFYASQP